MPLLLRFVLPVVVLMLFGSCYSYKKSVYLRSRYLTHKEPIVIGNIRSIYLVQPNDVLSIVIQGTEQEVSRIFNIAVAANSFDGNNSNLFMGGHSVDNNGYIVIPIIGKIFVKDKTLGEVQNFVQEEVNKYLNNATVIVKLVSFKVTVLGEVNNPGYHFVYNGQLTILEAIGLSGGISRTGKGSRVKLIRQANGQTTIVLLDLTKADVLYSKYYYLQPNDVVYVEPFKAVTSRENLDLLGIVFSGVTTALLVLNFVNQ